MQEKRVILVVDDERIVAEDISEALTQAGWEVCGTAMTGQQAIALAEHYKPDIVLMDIVLRGPMDGITAADEIRRRTDIPVVYLTAYSDAKMVERAKQTEPLGYIVKPFDEASLRTTLELAFFKSNLDRRLRESREWFLTTLRSIGDAVIAAMPDGSIAFLNPVAEKLTGWREADAKGRFVGDVVRLSEPNSGAPLDLTRLLKTSSRAEACLMRPDGTRTPVEITANPIQATDLGPIGGVLAIRDMSVAEAAKARQKEQQEQLEEQVRQRTTALKHRLDLERLVARISSDFASTPVEDLDAAIDRALAHVGEFFQVDRVYAAELRADPQIADGMHEWHAKGVPSAVGQYHAVQAELYRWLLIRYERGETVYVPDADALPTTATAERAIARALGFRSALAIPMAQSGKFFAVLGVETLHNPRAYSEEDQRVLRTIAENVASTLSRKRAVHERQQLQTELLHAQKMEAVGKLSGGIAHDFNNILMPIIGYTDLLLKRFSDPLIINDLMEIRRASELAASLTRQLLAFSRKQVLSKTLLDPNELVDSMRMLLRRIIGEDVHLTIDLADDMPLVRADRSQIQQVIMNLAVNARDAMPHGGKLKISTGFKHLRARSRKGKQGDYVCLEVEDTGSGIPNELLAQIFEPFFTTKGPLGTGLGLSVVQGIVEQHNGWTDIKSESGRGTLFSIYLPAIPKEAAAVENGVPEAALTAKVASEWPSGHGERILLVEDDESVLDFVTIALNDNNYVVFPAHSAEHALEVFDREHGRFDLVLSDTVLPGMNGPDLITRLLEKNPKLRPILTSGYTDKDVIVQMARKRQIVFMQKPYSLAELARTVRRVLDGTFHTTVT